MLLQECPCDGERERWPDVDVFRRHDLCVLCARGLAGAIVHADHGAQCTSRAYAELCRSLGVTQSMGAVGSSAGNALAEAGQARRHGSPRVGVGG